MTTPSPKNRKTICNSHSLFTLPFLGTDIDIHKKGVSSTHFWEEPLFFLKSGTLIFVLLGIIITDGCLHSGFALGSLCLRSGFALAPLLRVEEKSIQNGMKKTSSLYKVRAERACSLCRAKQRHGVTLYMVRAERACSLCRAKQRHEVISPLALRRFRVGANAAYGRM